MLDNYSHVTGGDPIANYARTQRQRTSAILLERAAQARVQALLAGNSHMLDPHYHVDDAVRYHSHHMIPERTQPTK